MEVFRLMVAACCLLVVCEAACTRGKESSTVPRVARLQVRRLLKRQAAYARSLKDAKDSSSFNCLAQYYGAHPHSYSISEGARVSLEACRILIKKHGIDKDDIYGEIEKYTDGEPALKPNNQTGYPDEPWPEVDIDVCPYPGHFVCDEEAKYRTFDGTCNNPQDPLRAAANTPLGRMLPAVYGDGVGFEEREAEGHQELPGARDVSLAVFDSDDKPDTDKTYLLMTFGQFIDHDITRTAITKKHNEDTGELENVKCGPDGCEENTPMTEDCWPIPLKDTDPIFGGRECLMFVRSEAVPPLNCKYSTREQVNEITAYIDASGVYGSSGEEALKLRDGDSSRGRMATSPHPDNSDLKDTMPQTDDPNCVSEDPDHECFLAGDERSNEQPGLSVMHTVFVREHNRIEEKLHALNPHWDGETLYQESRRIVGAMLQHITYNEFLPIILSRKTLKKYDLLLKKNVDYDPEVDPSIMNVFATAAYRFGHTLIPDVAPQGIDGDGDERLSEVFFDPAMLYNADGIDGIIEGMATESAQSVDASITAEVRDRLFEMAPGEGLDLPALNIQRGRDHGLPSYNDFREACGLKRAWEIEDLDPDMIQESVERFKEVYNHVNDIDLFPAGLSERPVKGGLVGPTFAHIIGKQFEGLRKGDSFWYQRRKGPQAFTKDQRRALSRTMLSKILCDNSDNIEKLQPWVLEKAEDDEDDDENYINEFDDGEWCFKSHDYMYFDDNTNDDEAEKSALLKKLFRGRKKYIRRQKLYNPKVRCDLLPDVDLTPWTEEAPVPEEEPPAP